MRRSFDCASARNCSFSVSENRCSAPAARPQVLRKVSAWCCCVAASWVRKLSICSFCVRATSPCCVSSVCWNVASVCVSSWRVPRGAARDLVAQIALELLHVGCGRGAAGVRPQGLQRVTGARSTRTQGQQQKQDQERERQPVEGHAPIVAAQAGIFALRAPTSGARPRRTRLHQQRQHRRGQRAGEHRRRVVDRQAGDDAFAEAAGADERRHRRGADVDHRRGLHAGQHRRQPRAAAARRAGLARRQAERQRRLRQARRARRASPACVLRTIGSSA